MKRARMVVLAIALVAAGLAVFLAKQFIGSRPSQIVQQKALGTVEVLVAKKDIRLGDVVKQAELGWQAWPKEAAQSAGYVVKGASPDAQKDYDGAIARSPFLMGEPIKKEKLIKSNEGGILAAILPEGMRAISTKISEESAVGGFILPNDRVDVIVTRKIKSKDNRAEQFVSDTLFRNVRVLAIGQQIEVQNGKQVATGKTATLELAPSQVETLTLGQSMGEIALTLRSLADTIKSNKEGPTGGGSLNNDEQTNSIRMLKYGSWSRAYGVK